MTKHGKSVPSSATTRRREKDVRSPTVLMNPFPSWRFSTVDLAGPFAWPKGTQKELEIVSKLHSFDSMRWSQIEGPDHHFLNAESLSGEAKGRLEVIGREDEIDSVFSFHLQGAPRIICIRERNIAKLLWFDARHMVCPSRKK